MSATGNRQGTIALQWNRPTTKLPSKKDCPTAKKIATIPAVKHLPMALPHPQLTKPNEPSETNRPSMKDLFAKSTTPSSERTKSVNTPMTESWTGTAADKEKSAAKERASFGSHEGRKETFIMTSRETSLEDKLKEEHDLSKRQLAQAREEMSVLKGKLEEKQVRMELLESRLAANEDAKEELAVLKDRLAEKSGRIERLETLLAAREDMKEEIGVLKGRLVEKDNRLVEKEERIERLEGELAAKERRIGQLEAAKDFW